MEDLLLLAGRKRASPTRLDGQVSGGGAATPRGERDRDRGRVTRRASSCSLHPVFLLDEAHLLHQDTLDHLYILMNYEWDRRALLSLVLIGLPELERRLMVGRNRPLYSRLSRRLTLGALTPDDTAEYMRTRLTKAGGSREVFTTDAIALIHEAAGGAHREIDRIATAALRLGAQRKKKLVERDTLAHVLEDSSET